MEQMKIEGSRCASTLGGHQARTNKVEFALVENELLHFPRRNETGELLPVTSVASLNRERDERANATFSLSNFTSIDERERNISQLYFLRYHDVCPVTIGR